MDFPYCNELFFLRKVGCCLKCCSRYCNINFSKKNIDSKNFLSEIKQFDEYETRTDTDPCIVCLGILQNDKLATIISQVKNQIDISNYECISVSLTLFIPTCVQIRERAVQIYLSQNYPCLYNGKIKIQNIKDFWKRYVLSELKNSTNKCMATSNQSSPLNMDIFTSYQQDKKECMKLWNNYEQLLHGTNFNNLNEETNLSKKMIDAVLDMISDEQFVRCYSVPPEIPKYSIHIEDLVCKHANIFIGGRYMKFSRKLCQTPWFLDGKYKMETSIQELICSDVINYTKAESLKFLSSGREDVDVRMLLFGRPFAIEVINPKITKNLQTELKYLHEKINTSTNRIQITNELKILNRDDLKKLKEGEHSKSKTYRALCILKKIVNSNIIMKKLSTIQNLRVIQNTPIRVLHRRAVFPRERMIYEIRSRQPTLEELKNYKKNITCLSNEYAFIIIDLKTQAGTYVKEFVHGDFNRTMPNLCYLLKTEIDIVALDVTNIALEWP